MQFLNANQAKRKESQIRDVSRKGESEIPCSGASLWTDVTTSHGFCFGLICAPHLHIFDLLSPFPSCFLSYFSYLFSSSRFSFTIIVYYNYYSLYSLFVSRNYHRHSLFIHSLLKAERTRVKTKWNMGFIRHRLTVIKSWTRQRERVTQI